MILAKECIQFILVHSKCDTHRHMVTLLCFPHHSASIQYSISHVNQSALHHFLSSSPIPQIIIPSLTSHTFLSLEQTAHPHRHGNSGTTADSLVLLGGWASQSCVFPRFFSSLSLLWRPFLYAHMALDLSCADKKTVNSMSRSHLILYPPKKGYFALKKQSHF